MALSEVKSKKASKHRDGKHQSRRRTGNTALPTLEKIAVEDVEVIGKHREVDPEKVESLAASMAEIGLRTPITVRRIEKALGTTVFALVAGRHRLEAARSLGWEHIDAFIMEGNDNDARIWQLMENLYRADLTPLQRAEHVAELVQLVRDGDKGGQAAHPGGKQPHDRGISRAAKILGFTRDEIRRSLKIAAISADVKTKAKELGLDHNQSALLKIAQAEGTDAQLETIKEIHSGKGSGSNTSARGEAKSNKKKGKAPAKGASDTAEIEASPPLAPESNDESDSDSQDSEDPDNLDGSTEKDRLFSELKAAWDNAPRSVRKRFVRKVLHLDLDGIDEEIWTA